MYSHQQLDMWHQNFIYCDANFSKYMLLWDLLFSNYRFLAGYIRNMLRSEEELNNGKVLKSGDESGAF